MSMMSLDEGKELVLNFLKNADGEEFDKCDVLFQIISNVEMERQSELFQYICEIHGTVDSDEKKSVAISKYNAQKSRLEEQYGDIVNSLIKTYCQQNQEESVFYGKLWSLIKESVIFDTEAAQIFALYFILIDKRIPYFKIDEKLLYSMSNSRFSELLQKSAREGQKIRFILKSDISQRTERASLLLNEFGFGIPGDDREAIEQYEIRLMQMVYILQEIEAEKLMALLSRLKN